MRKVKRPSSSTCADISESRDSKNYVRSTTNRSIPNTTLYWKGNVMLAVSVDERHREDVKFHNRGYDVPIRCYEQAHYFMWDITRPDWSCVITAKDFFELYEVDHVFANGTYHISAKPAIPSVQPEGVWFVFNYDGPAYPVNVFENEIDALRYALANMEQVVFWEYGALWSVKKIFDGKLLKEHCEIPTESVKF